MNMNSCAVIVTYHATPDYIAGFAELLPQLSNIVIVDNGSNQQTIAALELLVRNNAGRINLLRNEENLGIAAAQNQGIKHALAQQAEWILLLDQDSKPDANMLPEMLRSWQLLHDKMNDKKIAIIAPLLIEQNVDKPARYLLARGRFFFRREYINASQLSDQAVMVIASGAMIRADLFQHIGYMREDFFIDSVDHEFCLRARQAGYKILVVGAARLLHRQGNKEEYNIFGRKIISDNYIPQRRYYMFRNRLLLLRLYGKSFPFLYFYQIAACFYDLLRIIICEANKIEKIKQAMRGLWHGVISSCKIAAN